MNEQPVRRLAQLEGVVAPRPPAATVFAEQHPRRDVARVATYSGLDAIGRQLVDRECANGTGPEHSSPRLPAILGHDDAAVERAGVDAIDIQRVERNGGDEDTLRLPGWSEIGARQVFPRQAIIQRAIQA